MMTETAHLLAALQHGDSFFPSGQASFSWGLEDLASDGRITGAETLHAFIDGQLRYRWAGTDRVVLAAAHQANGDLDSVAEADRVLDAMSLPAGLREGSARMGAALLSIHVELETHQADVYRARVRKTIVPGHMAAVQGLVWRATGLSLDGALAVSAHGTCIGLLGAAMRLGLIGHLDGQRLLARLRETTVELLTDPAPPLDAATAYAPAVDIAIMHHETKTSRLFST